MGGPPSPRLLLAWIGVLAGALALTVSCGSAAENSTEPLFDSPTREEIGDDAELAFPEETPQFRSVVISDQELNVAFELAAGDLEAFVNDSGLDLIPDERTIIHASPVWDLNVSGAISGSLSTIGDLERSIEVVDDGSDTLKVRIVLRSTANAAASGDSTSDR